MEVQSSGENHQNQEAQPKGSESNSVQVEGNMVEGETIADVAVFSAIPLSTPNDDELAQNVSPGRSSG